MGTSVWASSDPADWEKTLENYWAHLEKSGKARLVELERWYQETLPSRLKEDKRMYKEDLVKLVDWKLTRGKWRPRLLTYAQNVSADAVLDCSSRAFKALDSLNVGEDCPPTIFQSALKPLLELKGVGPATATAILSAYHHSIPFLSDQALMAVSGSRDYTVPAAVRTMTALQEKAKALNGTQSLETWTAKLVEKGLFADSLASQTKPGKDEEKREATKGKRKRR